MEAKLALLLTAPVELLEGRFGFFSRAAVAQLPIPETDRNALWPIFDRYRDRFVCEDGLWRISSRELLLDWSQDLPLQAGTQ